MSGATAVRGRRLVSRELRAVIALLVVTAVALVGALAFGFAGTASPGRLDRALDRRLIAHFDSHPRLIQTVADLGGPVQIVVITALLVAVLIVVRRPRGALLAACSPAIASGITEGILKPLGRRYADLPAFPSGHATAFCALALVVIVAALDQAPPRLPRAVQLILVVAALGAAAAVMAALVAAQYHFATDVLGGACVALAVVLSLAVAIDWCTDSWLLRRA